MKALNRRIVAACLVLGVSASAFAEESGGVRLTPGEMGLLSFVEMLSDKLDFSIDGSGLEASLEQVKVTVPDVGRVSRERAEAVALSVLYLEGYTWIKDEPTGLYRVVRQRDARDQEIPFITGSGELPDNDLLVTYLLPIRHTFPDYVARILRSFMPANSRIIPDEASKAVLITDSARNIAKLEKLVENLDTEMAAQKAKKWLEERSGEAAEKCPESAASAHGPPSAVLIALFSLIALVIGFLARGYVIRRIEGGL